MIDRARFAIPEYESALATIVVGRDFRYHQKVGSTMDLARAAAGDGAGHGTLVFAEEQTAGRGRRGRSFYSPSGLNLYFTLVLRLPLEQHRRLPVVLPVAVCEAIAATGVDAAIKWPNDIWIGERKAAGMLIDGEITEGGAVALPGIGINVNGDPTVEPELAQIATSLRRQLGHHVAREALLADLCGRLEAALEAPFEVVLARYRELSCIVGRSVIVHPVAGEAFEGRAEAIMEDGSLQVIRTGGMIETVTAADVSVRPLAVPLAEHRRS
jgi:BirA family biotin operon repressor/biotin-[acetyl-CoA-carboxylase] ligase